MNRCLILVIPFAIVAVAFKKGRCGVPQQDLIEEYHRNNFPNLNQMNCTIAKLAEEDYYDHDNCTFSAEVGRVGPHQKCYSGCITQNVLRGFDSQKEKAGRLYAYILI
ncbi:hypothetical protein Q1695_016401 [Nippostrongylus brasiliensis]|nr:hypothetical protein Q1695_016401 [Nippostrongylus brasiliensis]